MIRNIITFFDKLEDRVRHNLSRRPVVYAFIGGLAIVLFWRGVWHLADDYGMTSWESLIVSVVIMMLTGTFVSFFVGESILLSGLKEEKRIDQRTEEDIRNEEERLTVLIKEIEQIRDGVADMRKKLGLHDASAESIIKIRVEKHKKKGSLRA